MQISTKPGYYQAMAKLRGRSDLMETSVINPFTETASGKESLQIKALQNCLTLLCRTAKGWQS